MEIGFKNTFESTPELTDKLNDGADAVSPLEPDQMVESRVEDRRSGKF